MRQDLAWCTWHSSNSWNACPVSFTTNLRFPFQFQLGWPHLCFSCFFFFACASFFWLNSRGTLTLENDSFPCQSAERVCWSAKYHFNCPGQANYLSRYRGTSTTNAPNPEHVVSSLNSKFDAHCKEGLLAQRCIGSSKKHSAWPPHRPSLLPTVETTKWRPCTYRVFVFVLSLPLYFFLWHLPFCICV